MKKIIAIVGPTASGKTALSIELAKMLNGEIISCDSMQIYKKMDIGSAKPTSGEMCGIKHYMIDIVEPWENFSCMDYVTLAREKINDIYSVGKIPIFCGGTGLYIENIMNNTSFSDSTKDEEYRELLNGEAKTFGNQFLHNKLTQIDPESAENIHPNNVKRVIRALEVYHTTGKTKTEWDKESRKVEPSFDCKMIFLDFKDRNILYSRIDRRVDIMVENGLLDEVKALYHSDKKLSETAAQGIGYKELFDYFDGKTELSCAIDLIKQASRNYAKRQLTWFRRYKDAIKIYVDEFDSVGSILKSINTINLLD